MTPGLRKFALTVHVACSVGLLGSIAAFLALAIAAATYQDVEIIRATYPAMDLTARLVIVPLAFAALLSGLIQSLGTPWGLFRHYWVLAKLVLTAFATIVLLAKMELIGHAVRLAGEAVLPLADLRALGIELAVHAATGLLVLLVPTVLSIYKPRGLTPYGRRVQQRERTPSFPASRQRPLLDSSGVGATPSGGSITFTLRWTYVFGILVVVAVAHILILHVTGIGLGAH